MTTIPSEALLPRILAWDNLLRAWERVEENDGSAGVDGVTVEDYARQLEENLTVLQRDVRSGTYRPVPLLRIYVPKPDGGRRPLSIPSVRDRVAQEAVAVVITPILEPHFEECSYGYRRGRSVQQAIARVRAYHEQGYSWVVDADIDSFFDEVDHDVLLTHLGNYVNDPDVIALIHRWLGGEVRDGQRMLRPSKGLPQGLPISPVLANLYLDTFDEELLRRGYKLVRFADDFLILCKNQPKAKQALEITETLLGELGLALNREKTRITDFERGFRYLGTLFLRSLVLPSPRRKASDVGESVDAAPPKVGGPVQHGRRVAGAPTVMALAFGQALERAGIDSQECGESHHISATGLAADGLSAGPVLGAAPAPEPEREPEARAGGTPDAVDDGRSIAAPGRRVRFMSARTLYIQEQGSVLARDGERLVVRKGEDVLLEVPARKVDQVFVFGRCALTTPAMTYCLQEDIPVVLLSNRGQYYGILESPLGDQVGLHRTQFTRAADEAFCLATAKMIVAGKLQNCRVLLHRHHRAKGDHEVAAAAREVERLRNRVLPAPTLEAVHGYEGAAAACYFEAFGRLLDRELGFVRRVRRPPTDPVNSVLSFGYTLLFYNVYALIRARGLHPYVGHLHVMRDRHPSLASDLMEEFRVPVVDSLALYLFNSKLLTVRDFYRSREDGGPCLLKDDARRTFFKHFEHKMSARITHPHTGYTVDYRRCIDLQVCQMTQYVRGEVAEYRPMVIR